MRKCKFERVFRKESRCYWRCAVQQDNEVLFTFVLNIFHLVEWQENTCTTHCWQSRISKFVLERFDFLEYMLIGCLYCTRRLYLSYKGVMRSAYGTRRVKRYIHYSINKNVPCGRVYREIIVWEWCWTSCADVTFTVSVGELNLDLPSTLNPWPVHVFVMITAIWNTNFLISQFDVSFCRSFFQ